MTVKAPKATVIKEADMDTDKFHFSDRTGRQLEYRKLSMYDQALLADAAGGESAENRTFMFIAAAAASIRSIDGVPTLFPRTRPQLEAAIQKVDDGIEDLQKELARRMDTVSDKVENEVESIKN